MLTTVPFAPGTSLASAPVEKLDEFLEAALAGDPAYARWADAQGRYDVLVAGPLHPDPEVLPAGRGAWNAYWQEQAAPFFAQVRAALKPGDLWVSELATGPVVKLRLAPARVDDFAALPLVQGLALDWPEAVAVLEEDLPLPGDGPGVAMGQSVGMTGAFDLHALGFYGQGIKLAVIDTGIRPTHEMLLDEFGATRVIGWADKTTNPGGPGYCANPCDTHDHGTHVATTAAGSDLVGGRYQGVAPRAQLIGVRIFQGGSGQWEWAQAGLQAAFDLGADVTTNSWGGGCGSDPNTGGWLTQRIAENLAKAGLQHVFAAGNSGPGSAGNLCPGRSDLVIAVGATDKSKVIAGFSSGGKCPDASGAMTRICPDVSAVGVNVEAGCKNSDTCYTSMSGTSMATPHVAGGAVLMHQLAKALQDKTYNVSAQELELFFEQHAQDLGAAGNDERYGWGFIRLSNMQDALLAGAQARVTVDVGVSRTEMRSRDTNTASVMLNNVGGKTVTGTLRVLASGALSRDGREYLSQAVTLAPGESRVVTASIPGANLDPTTYRVVASLAYTYTANDGAPQGTTVEDRTSFLLRGVKMSAARAGGSGFGTSFAAGNATTITLTLRNVGNEPATNVNLVEGVPQVGYEVVPSATATGLPYGPFSQPAPNSLAVNTDRKTLDMAYTPSAVNPGAPYTVRYNVRGLVPGDYTFSALVTFTDGAGDTFNVALDQSAPVKCFYINPSRTLPPVTCPSV